VLSISQASLYFYDNVRNLTFMMSSGLNAPKPAMPMPALEVPKAAPMAVTSTSCQHIHIHSHMLMWTHTTEDHLSKMHTL
jgi:hypothetical protein